MTTTPAQHTPGPWRAEGWDNLVVNSRDGDTIICEPGGSEYASKEELQANARLIAAGPDMLAALKGLVNIATHPAATKKDIMQIASEARAVIEQATGEVQP